MHQKIAVVAQNPLALLIALNAVRQLTVPFELDSDLVGDGLILAGVRTRADYEVVGERRDPGKVQNFDVGRLFFLSRANGGKPSGFGLKF